MSQNSITAIWTPADARQAAELAAQHPTERGVAVEERPRLRTWVWAPLLITAGILIPGLAASTARADSADDVYVTVLSEQGITHTSGSAGLIALGHEVCQDRANGYSEMQVVDRIYRVSQLNAFDSGFVVGAAEAAYCPWYTTLTSAAVRDEAPAAHWVPGGSMGGRLA